MARMACMEECRPLKLLLVCRCLSLYIAHNWHRHGTLLIMVPEHFIFYPGTWTLVWHVNFKSILHSKQTYESADFEIFTLPLPRAKRYKLQLT